MLCFHNTTYCASPNCTNQCGRKFNQELAIRTKQVVAFAYFCGTSEQEYQVTTDRGPMRIAAPSMESAVAIAKKDGYRVPQPTDSE